MVSIIDSNNQYRNNLYIRNYHERNYIINNISYNVFFLRSYAGGYHALTARRCFAINVFSYIFVILIIKYTSVDAYLFWILLCFSSVIIIGLSPVASCNKHIKMKIIIWLIESSILLFLRYLQFNKTAMCILMAQLTVSLALILGKIAEGRSKNI